MNSNIFEKLKNNLTDMDPVVFTERYLTLDGKPMKINKSGYKPFSDIYRYIGITALQDNSKPVLLVKGRQVGATTMAAAITLFYLCCGIFGVGNRNSMRLMHVFPTLIHVFRYAKTKFNPMISGAVQIGDAKLGKKTKSYIESKIDKNSASNDSLQYKQFINGNFVQIESTGLDSSRLRGGTVDCMLFDEVQDIPAIAIQNALKLLSQSQHGPKGKGIQVYMGTPKNKGSAYWNMWQDSNQQYYYLGCEECEKHFPLYTPGSSDWEKIWLYGFIVKCTHCGKEQDKRDAAERGKWIAHGNPDGRFQSYHINQLYMPIFTKEAILADKPENNANVGEITWQNEILGEFYAGDSAPITSDEIRELCADFGRKFRSSIYIKDNMKVYAGFDWGQKNSISGSENKNQGQSYSCGVILTEQNNILSIDFATTLKRNNFSEKKEIVEQMLRQYSVKLAIGDIGYANDLTEVLQNTYGDRFLASRAIHQLNGHFKYRSEQFPKEVQFERDYLIAEVFDLMKRGLIRFPYGDYEKIEWLVSHCCSMEIKTTANRVNEPVSRYVKGSTPNDGFMALVNAYLAYKFDKTGGFSQTGGGSLILPDNRGGKILATTGYIPRMR